MIRSTICRPASLSTLLFINFLVLNNTFSSRLYNDSIISCKAYLAGMPRSNYVRRGNFNEKVELFSKALKRVLVKSVLA